MRTLNELFEQPSVVGYVIIFLSGGLKQLSSKGIETTAEISDLYSRVLNIHNLVQDKRGKEKAKFKYPSKTISTFLEITEEAFIYNAEGLKAINATITADTLKLDFALFVYFSLMSEFTEFRIAFTMSLALKDRQFLPILQTIHQIVNEDCGFQCTLSQNEFMECALQMQKVIRGLPVT